MQPSSARVMSMSLISSPFTRSIFVGVGFDVGDDCQLGHWNRSLVFLSDAQDLRRSSFRDKQVRIEHIIRKFRLMLLDNLRLFLTIAEKGSLVAAARETGMSSTTVSERLAALEGTLRCGFVQPHHPFN